MTALTLAEIAEYLDGTLHGDGDIKIEKIATLANATDGCIGFLGNSKYTSQLESTKASAVLISPKELSYLQQHNSAAAIVLDNPYLGYAKLAQKMDTTPKQKVGIHPSAVVEPSAVVDPSASIGANSVIQAGATIAADVIIGANCYVGEGSQIGKGTRLWANVSVYHDVTIGEHCLFQSGCAIGSDGFGYAPDGKHWVKIPQLGGVRIGDRVEVGANTCIDRGALDDTIIGNGVIIDNMVQIAHNVVVGDNTAMAGHSGIAGSSTVGENCTLGGRAGVAGHLTIVDNVLITAETVATSNITQPGAYSSCIPGIPIKDWRRVNARIRQLDDSHKRLRECEKQIAKLQEPQGES